jgi:hypothetical protein
VTFVIVEKFGNENYSRVLGVIFIIFSKLFLAPIEKSTNKGRDEEEFAVSASNSLYHMEDQSHINFDSMIKQKLSSFDSLPCRSDLDENAFLANSCLLIKGYDSLCSFNSCVFVERKRGINLCRNVTFNSFQNFNTE